MSSYKSLITLLVDLEEALENLLTLVIYEPAS